MKGRTDDPRKTSPSKRRLFGPVDHNQNRVDANELWTNLNEHSRTRVDFDPSFRPRVVTTEPSSSSPPQDTAGTADTDRAALGADDDDGSLYGAVGDSTASGLPRTGVAVGLLGETRTRLSPTGTRLTRRSDSATDEVSSRNAHTSVWTTYGWRRCPSAGQLSSTHPHFLQGSTPPLAIPSLVATSFTPPPVNSSGSAVKPLISISCSGARSSIGWVEVKLTGAGRVASPVRPHSLQGEDDQGHRRPSPADKFLFTPSSEDQASKSGGRKVPVVQVRGDERVPALEDCFFKPIGAEEESSTPTGRRSTDEEFHFRSSGEPEAEVRSEPEADFRRSEADRGSAETGAVNQRPPLRRRRVDSEDGVEDSREETAVRSGCELFSDENIRSVFKGRRFTEKLKEFVEPIRPPDPKKSRTSDNNEDNEPSSSSSSASSSSSS